MPGPEVYRAYTPVYAEKENLVFWVFFAYLPKDKSWRLTSSVQHAHQRSRNTVDCLKCLKIIAEVFLLRPFSSGQSKEIHSIHFHLPHLHINKLTTGTMQCFFQAHHRSIPVSIHTSSSLSFLNLSISSCILINNVKQMLEAGMCENHHIMIFR